MIRVNTKFRSKRSIVLWPTRYRLDLSIVKSRNPDDRSLLSSLGRLRRVRKGNKLSRFFRHVFEKKSVKKLLGGNIALLLFASSISPFTSGIDVDAFSAGTNEPVILTTHESVSYPLEIISITQGYHAGHPAIDFDGITGDPVYSVLPGEVIATGWSNRGYGNSVLVSHGDDLVSLYAHLSKIFVKRGDKVNTRDILGEVGATGRSFGDHLHLEIRKDGKAINPLSLLTQ